MPYELIMPVRGWLGAVWDVFQAPCLIMDATTAQGAARNTGLGMEAFHERGNSKCPRTNAPGRSAARSSAGVVACADRATGLCRRSAERTNPPLQANGFLREYAGAIQNPIRGIRCPGRDPKVPRVWRCVAWFPAFPPAMWNPHAGRRITGSPSWGPPACPLVNGPSGTPASAFQEEVDHAQAGIQWAFR